MFTIDAALQLSPLTGVPALVGITPHPPDN